LLQLRKSVTVPLNLDLAATDEMVEIALQSKPDMAMFVPEGRLEITTEGGLDVVGDASRLREIISLLKGAGMKASAFVDADVAQLDSVLDCGFSVCEIHTGAYAQAVINNDFLLDSSNVQHELDKIRIAVEHATEIGLQCNAGHGLTHFNVYQIASINNISELHIGHSIVSRSIFVGMRESVREMKQEIKEATNE
jgi:pyridoxine 5-phosphate synthase